MAGAWSIVYVMLLLYGAARAEFVQIVTPEVPTTEVEFQSQNTTSHKRDVPASSPRDSYMEALSLSQGSSSRFDQPEPEDVFYKNEEIVEHGVYGPSQGYHYNDPSSYHSGPKYPSPPVIYGPPAPVPYPSAFSHGGTPFAAPHNPLMSMLPSLIPKGLDLETVFKLLLKLILFKLIIKFIAVICLMFVWPLFQSKEKEQEHEDDKRRQLEYLNDLTELVWKSIFPENSNNGTVSEEYDDVDENLVEKVAGEIDEKMTAPSEEAAIGFLQFCVSVANSAIGWMMSFLRRRNNEIDPLEELIWSYWEKLKAKLFKG